MFNRPTGRGKPGLFTGYLLISRRALAPGLGRNDNRGLAPCG